jgi:hypothetical protein
MSKFVLVETISQYRMRYVIEVPDDHNDGEFPCTAETWAEDTVTMEEMTEFSQKWLGYVMQIMIIVILGKMNIRSQSLLLRLDLRKTGNVHF